MRYAALPRSRPKAHELPKHEHFIAAYLIVMGALIITVDVLFLRNHYWARLGTNIAVVTVFLLAYVLLRRNLFT